MSYFEHPSYVPLVRESFRLWRELEAASGEVSSSSDLEKADELGRKASKENGFISATSSAG